jgi:oligoribonuclease NrnB/cAMP/cGMP phosphodiesterase (DHH superfamily)
MNIHLEPETTKYVVITHYPCRDGFVASICARKHYQETYGPKYGGLMPIFWGVEPSKQVDDIKKFIDKIKSEDTEQKIRKIFIESFDIAFNPDTIIGMVRNNPTIEFNIRIMDHHKSSLDSWKVDIPNVNTLEENKNLSNIYKRVITIDSATINSSWIEFICNMEQCGASLAWEYYFPNKKIPLFIEYVKDRDNWLFDTEDAKNRYSMEVNEYLMATAPKYDNFAAWFEYFDRIDDYFYVTAYHGGKTLMDMKTSYINMLLNCGTNRVIGGHTVFVCNSPILMSDVGNVACEKYNVGETVPSQKLYLCDYAMIWRYDEKCKKYCVSLRSRKGGIDVQEIAKKYNGGGHINAAGFETDNMNFLEIIPVTN